MERLKVNPSIEQNQRARLAELRAKRDQAKASELMTRLEQAGRGDESMIPLFIECVENNLTLGEITGVLRGVWGANIRRRGWGVKKFLHRRPLQGRRTRRTLSFFEKKRNKNYYERYGDKENRMAKLTKINHIGIAVNNIDEALPFWTEGLGLKLHHVEEVARQKSKVAFLPVGRGERCGAGSSDRGRFDDEQIPD